MATEGGHGPCETKLTHGDDDWGLLSQSSTLHNCCAAEIASIALQEHMLHPSALLAHAEHPWLSLQSLKFMRSNTETENICAILLFDILGFRLIPVM